MTRQAKALGEDPLTAYWEFAIHLVPPAGSIHVFARDFLFEECDMRLRAQVKTGILQAAVWSPLSETTS
jgi:hypothetical protein